ncbi:antitoxin [Ursidibacter sp. B-7004-1]
MVTAKLFWTGNSQAIRLPKAFRFIGESVRIHKQGNKVIIEPIT